jgi:hypothetical protein
MAGITRAVTSSKVGQRAMATSVSVGQLREVSYVHVLYMNDLMDGSREGFILLEETVQRIL